MKIGDLVKFIENPAKGDKRELCGIVIDKLKDPAPLYRIRWFDKESPDTWHKNPKKEGNEVTDLFVISEA